MDRNNMEIPPEAFNKLMNQLAEQDKRSLFDYLQYLVSRSSAKAWNKIPEVDEPLTEEEMYHLQNKSGERVSMEELRRELGL